MSEPRLRDIAGRVIVAMSIMTLSVGLWAIGASEVSGAIKLTLYLIFVTPMVCAVCVGAFGWLMYQPPVKFIRDAALWIKEAW